MQHEVIVSRVSAENFSGGEGSTEKQDRKITPLSFSLLYHVNMYEDPGGHGFLTPLPTPMYSMLNCC